jgi:hypothetical protein
MTLLTQSGHRGGFQFAPQQTLRRFIRSLGAEPAAMLAPRNHQKCSSLDPVGNKPNGQKDNGNYWLIATR